VTKQRRLTVGLAIAGLVITVGFFTYNEFLDYSRPLSRLDFAVGLILTILCPPSLLGLFCIDCEARTWAGVEMWSVIGLLNVALYSGIGLAVGRYMERSKQSSAGVEK